MPKAVIPEEAYALAASLVAYDPLTGIFTWLPRPLDGLDAARWNSRYAGKEAGLNKGSSHERREIRIRVKEKRFCIQAHRLAWFMVYGKVPQFEIDHYDQDWMNNRIANLRDVPASVNSKNLPTRASSKTGVAGVIWGKRERRWRTNVTVNKKIHFLGTYKDFDAAVKVVTEFRAANGFTPHHGLRPPRPRKERHG